MEAKNKNKHRGNKGQRPQVFNLKDRQPAINYESLFIRQADITGRQEKTTYLREEYYNRIMKILLLYGNPRLSVFAYVDAVLEHHFELYRDDIMDIYNKKNSAPY